MNTSSTPFYRLWPNFAWLRKTALVLAAQFFSAFATAFAAEPLELPGVHNAFRVTPNVLSGSQPEGDTAFAALARLGVKTLVSVDGAKPDVAAARRHGLRYIHLPIGYDGIPAGRVPELARAAGDGPVFVHCHHGKHRGPAAVAIICQSTSGWTPAEAEAWMKNAGTAADYAGLYRAAREFRPITAEQLAKVGPLPEVAKTPDIIDAMVALDERYDALKTAQKSGWKTPAATDATLLWEHLRELARTEDTAARPADYRTTLAENEIAAKGLRNALQATPLDTAAADVAFKAIGQSCITCHKAHRNKKD